jgi:hypothetical protein
MNTFKNGDRVKFGDYDITYEVFGANSEGAHYRCVERNMPSDDFFASIVVGYEGPFVSWDCWGQARLCMPEDIIPAVFSDQCPKCGSEKVNWISLAMKCNDCWYVW